ncbi:MAG: hypothetical protein PHF79_01765 [Candidatus Pacebacteria bacterium]|nr:hypothetical protein [Candidatus Paceibacterota bacterium]
MEIVVKKEEVQIDLDTLKDWERIVADCRKETKRGKNTLPHVEVWKIDPENGALTLKYSIGPAYVEVMVPESKYTRLQNLKG